MAVVLGLAGLVTEASTTVEPGTSASISSQLLSERDDDSFLSLIGKDDEVDGGLGYLAARMLGEADKLKQQATASKQGQQSRAAQAPPDSPKDTESTASTKRQSNSAAVARGAWVGARKFVLAAHPAVQFLGRWNQPSVSVPFDFLPNGTDSYFTSGANTSASTGWGAAAVYLRVYGTTSVSVHMDPTASVSCSTRVSQWGNWTFTMFYRQAGYAIQGLDPAKVYDLEFRFLFFAPVFTLRGFGLDLKPTALPMTRHQGRYQHPQHAHRLFEIRTFYRFRNLEIKPTTNFLHARRHLYPLG